MSKTMPMRVGLEEYENHVFMVHDGNGGGLQVFEDPADAIGEAEELAFSEDSIWYVTALRAADADDNGVPVHIARPKTKRRTNAGNGPRRNTSRVGGGK